MRAFGVRAFGMGFFDTMPSWHACLAYGFLTQCHLGTHARISSYINGRVFFLRRLVDSLSITKISFVLLRDL